MVGLSRAKKSFFIGGIYLFTKGSEKRIYKEIRRVWRKIKRKKLFKEVRIWKYFKIKEWSIWGTMWTQITTGRIILASWIKSCKALERP